MSRDFARRDEHRPVIAGRLQRGDLAGKGEGVSGTQRGFRGHITYLDFLKAGRGMRFGPVPFATLNVYSESGRVSTAAGGIDISQKCGKCPGFPPAAVDISQKHCEVPGLSDFG